jgi:hypothetical protein
LLNKVIDVGVAIVSTVLGIILIFAAAQPRVEFGDVVSRSRRGKGLRYGLQIRGLGRIPIQEMRVYAALLVPTVRQTTVFVPLSRDLWTNVRRRKNKEKWRAVPRLLLDDVEWKKVLPPGLPRPKKGAQLEEVMRTLNADLLVRVTATSFLFAVTAIRIRRYSVDEIHDWDARN